VAILIRRRRDTQADWVSVDPIIPTGQLAFELGTGENGTPRIKFGNGTNVFSDLPYLSAKNNLSAVSDPTISNNASQSYSIGSFWVNAAATRGFILTSFSGADAIWTPWGGLISSITQIQGVPAFPNDGYDYVLVENNGTLTWELYTTGGDAVDSVNGLTGVVILNLDDLNDVPAYPNDGYQYVLVEENGVLTWELYVSSAGAVDSVNGLTGIVVLNLDDINDVPAYPNDGYQYVLVEENGVVTWELLPAAGVDSVNGLTGVVVLNLDDINDVPAYPNDGYKYVLTEDSGVLAWELYTAGTIPQEEEIEGTAIYDGAVTGTYNLDLSTFTAFYGVLTGNTIITVSNTPASGDSFVRSLKIRSYATESLTLPVTWEVVSGSYTADGTLHDFQIEFSNFPTEGLLVTVYINPIP
jgi:hypothetical protein